MEVIQKKKKNLRADIGMGEQLTRLVAAIALVKEYLHVQ